jgi:hypothetical protein
MITKFSSLRQKWFCIALCLYLLSRLNTGNTVIEINHDAIDAKTTQNHFIFIIIVTARSHSNQLRILSPSSSSARYSPLLDMGLSNSPTLHLARSSATRIQLLRALLRKSSLHLPWGRPTLRLPRGGLHSRTRLSQRLSVLRLIWLLQQRKTVCYVGDFSSVPDHLVPD